MRFFLVDRIEELKKLEYAEGLKCISLADDAFEHHFPGQPVYPGVLLVESLAQLGGALLELSLRDHLEYCPRCVLSKVEARFREFARPGDALRLRVDIVSRHADSALVRARATRGETRVCEAELMYVFLRIEGAARSLPSARGSPPTTTGCERRAPASPPLRGSTPRPSPAEWPAR